jgi:ubiquinone/menaquinone biosynthesis C-methylase UbiE
MELHQTARQGFGQAGIADAYERSRPGYPDEAVAWLAAELGLREGATVVDLAAGTGKLTRSLAGTGARVIAVEPVSQMLEILERRLPESEAREGTAEDSGLAGECADAVTVAQAFHWFDGPAALAEIDRILRPRGKLALVWNVRDLDHPTQRAVHELLAPHRGSTPSHRSERWRESLDRTGLFRTSAVRHFPNPETLDAQGLVSRVESTSFIARLPEGERDGILEQVREVASELPSRFPFPYTTEVEIFERASPRREATTAPRPPA